MADRFPKSWSTRLGNFGEVIGAEHVRQHLGYQVPIYRLRYNQNFDQSIKGDDALGFSIQGKKLTVLVLESKARSSFDHKVVSEGLRSLIAPTSGTTPTTFQFALDRLLDENADLAREVMRLWNRRMRIEHLLFLVYQGLPHGNPAQRVVKEPNIPTGLRIVDIALEKLKPLVNTTFEQAKKHTP